MTWSLNASGHLQDKESEEGLVKALRGLLAKYGAQSSFFGGTFVGRVEGLHGVETAAVPSAIGGPKAAVAAEPEPDVKTGPAKSAK